MATRVKIYALILILMLMLCMGLLASRSGLTEDVRYNQGHGTILFQYFTGQSEIGGMSPFEPNGDVLPAVEDLPYTDVTWKRLNFYGGFPDALSHAVRFIFGYSESLIAANVISAIYGALMIFAGAMATYYLSGSTLGFFVGLLTFALCPRLIGHSLNNPKDIPMALFFMFAYCQFILLWKEMPKIKSRRLILVSLACALTLSVRMAGLLSLFYLWILMIIWLCSHVSRQTTLEDLSRQIFDVILPCVVMTVLSVFLTMVFWPYFGNAGLKGMLALQRATSGFGIFNSYDLFEGVWINRWELPWYYVIKWFVITIPPHVMCGLLLFIASFFIKTNISRGLRLGLFSIFIFPLLLQVLMKSNTYNDGRHFYFSLVGFVLLSSTGWTVVLGYFQTRKTYTRFLCPASLVILIIPTLLWMITNPLGMHAYFSPIIGGTKGAFKKYEIDYWGATNRQAAEWINQHADDLRFAPNVPLKVRHWYGDAITSRYFFDQSKNIEFIKGAENSANWDVWIYNTAGGKFNQSWIHDWPPPNTIHEIKVSDAPTVAIIKNHRLDDKDYRARRYFSLGMEAYLKENFKQSISFYLKAFEINPNNPDLLNNLGYSYFLDNDFNNARQYYLIGLKLNPKHEAMKNNLTNLDKINR